jgi:hypothetical protein
MPFGQHLCTHQNAGATVLNFGQQTFQFIFFASHIAVNADDIRGWKTLLQESFTAFSADTNRLHGFAATIRTVTKNRMSPFAVVTAQMRRVFVDGQACVTERALGSPATIAALLKGSKTTAVDKHQYLIAIIDVPLDVIQQQRRESLLHVLGVCINQHKGRFVCHTGSLRESQARISP